MENDYGIDKKWEETVLHAVEAARHRCLLTNPYTGNWDGEKTKRFNKHLSDEIKSRDWSILNDLGDDLFKEVSELVAEIKNPHETLFHKNQSEDDKQIEKVNGCLLDAMAMDVLMGALERFYIEEDKLKYAQDAVQKREEELKAEHAIREKELINIQELIDALKAKQGRKGTKNRHKRGVGGHGPKTEFMKKQLEDFVKYMRNLKTPKKSAEFHAKQFWNQKENKEQYDKAKKAQGQKKGYASPACLAGAYRNLKS